MSNSVQPSSNGIGFFGFLQLLFIALKLTEVITWSWWLVMLPALVGVSLLVSVIAIAIWFSK